MLSPVDFEIAIFNSDRELSHDWDAFTNNVDAGVQITNLPSLPLTLTRLTGTSVNLQVTPDGPSQITGTLDFQFDFPVDPTTLQVAVTGQRIVMLLFPPEVPLTEKLGFLTDVMEHIDGTEQRVALRKAPRQELEMVFLLEDGPERQRFDFVLFDRQDKVFGIPMWHEPMALTSAAAIDDVTINVDTTDFTDLRVGNQAVVLDGDGVTFDALVILSFTATSITFESGLTNAYPEGTEVYPMQSAIIQQTVSGNRRARNLQEVRVNARMLDQDLDIADTSAFSTFNSKVLLDDPNLVEGPQPYDSERRIFSVDGETGSFQQKSLWPVSRRGSQKGFVMNTRQRLWEVRQLLHALKGRQISFYLPTFYEDLTQAATFSNGSTTGVIVNVGYDQFVRERQPNDVIQVRLKDGTEFIRTITGSDPIDDDTEQITIDTGWPQDINVGDIDRISFVEKVRLASDEVAITHERGGGQARVIFPVKAVTD